MMTYTIQNLILTMSASGRGARVLLVQVSSISCKIAGSILALHTWKTLTQHCRRLVDGCLGTPRPVLLTGAKKSHLGS